MKALDDSGGWWGGDGRGQGRLTILDLIANGTISVKLAALLWLLVQHKVSLLAAAGPQLAGKTTLLTALLDLAPPRIDTVLTKGRAEDFSFLANTDPSSTYVLVPELSDHTPAYLWGDPVRTLFDALEDGYSVAATMHADAPEQVTQMLRQPPVAVPSRLLHHVGVVINIRMRYGERGMVRRVSRATLVEPGPRFVPLPTWDPDREEQPVARDPSAYIDAVAERTGGGDPRPSLAQLQDTLEGWMSEPPADAGAFSHRVSEFYSANR